MAPTDFLDLAARLMADGTEAAFRTAVSRVYYGEFHAAVLLIRGMGVSLPIGPESHQKVRYCLMESGEAAGLQAGDSLQILRQDRNRQDYDLDASAVFNKHHAALLRVNGARAVLGLLQNCRAEPVRSRFRVKLRIAASVLRLPVTGT